MKIGPMYAEEIMPGDIVRVAPEQWRIVKENTIMSEEPLQGILDFHGGERAEFGGEVQTFRTARIGVNVWA